MSSPTGNFIRERRQALDLTQDDAAQALGLHRVVYCRYESGDRSVPVAALPAPASMLLVDVDYLASLRERAPRGSVESVRELAPLTPLTCSIGDMLARMPRTQRLHDTVRSMIPERQYQDLSANLLRQTAPELALAFVMLLASGNLVWTSLTEVGSRLLCIADDARSYAGHLLRLAISWERDGERIVLFPQVPLLVPKSDRRYRIDYLAVQTVPGRPPQMW